MANLIVVASPFHGHVMPLVTVAADLVRRGHEVLFWTGRAFAEQARSTGARFVPFPEKVDYDGRDILHYFPDFATVASGSDTHRFFWKRIFLDPIPEQFNGLKKLLTNFPSKIVIHDQVFLGAFPYILGPKTTKRPTTISLGILVPTLLSKDAIPFGLGLTAQDVEGRPEQISELNMLVRQTFADIQKHAESVFALVGITLDDFIFNSLVSTPDYYLQMSVPGFEYQRSDWPASFRFVGALPLPRSQAFHEPDWWPELFSGRPIVVVTQGTVANDDLASLIIPTIQGLANSDELVIAVTARKDGPEFVRRIIDKVPDNVRLAGYVPFDLLLPHASILITNGGQGGVFAALQHGLPLIVTGNTEEKPEVSARVQNCGAGIYLRTAIPTPEQIRIAVRSVLSQPSFRGAATKLKSEFAQYRSLDAIAELVQSLC
jgi:MGT family glycosyltransferase